MAGMQPSDTIGAILGRNRGAGPSFDHLRLLLALLLLIGHAKWVAGAPSLGLVSTGADLSHGMATAGAAVHWVGFTKPILRALVPSFFALSGFLVLGSALRVRATSTFLAHRALRIFPALLVEVTLSALILGPLVTAVPFRDYFANPEFARYFGNVIGWVSFILPGVFADNPVPRIVNMNLWTLPSEFHCYLIAAALLMTKVIYDKKLFAAAFVMVTIGLALAHLFTGISMPSGPFPPHVIVYYFFVGAFFYHFRDRIPVHPGIFAGALVISYVALMYDSLVDVAPIPLTYCTVFFGLMRLPKIRLIASGDYSYGIYLYGFPITQTYVHVFPDLGRHVVLLILLAAGTTFAFAALSWHCIEKRALALKAHLPQSWFPAVARAH
jgi:peptidoglycan/LPS O-acetylase OafA/YrhL